MVRGNMPRLPSIVALAAVLGLPPALGGCVGVVVGGMAAAAGGGYVVGQERGADGLASDFSITTDIRQALARTDPQLDAAVTVTVYDGRAALDAIAERRPDVVLLDLGMPTLDGFETCQQIRAMPDGDKIAVMATTGTGGCRSPRSSRTLRFPSSPASSASLSC